MTTPITAVKLEPAAEPAKPSPFVGFSYGTKAEEVKKTEAESKGVDLSVQKNLVSFADLATTTGKQSPLNGFPTKTSSLESSAFQICLLRLFMLIW